MSILTTNQFRSACARAHRSLFTGLKRRVKDPDLTALQKHYRQQELSRIERHLFLVRPILSRAYYAVEVEHADTTTVYHLPNGHRLTRQHDHYCYTKPLTSPPLPLDRLTEDGRLILFEHRPDYHEPRLLDYTQLLTWFTTLVSLFDYALSCRDGHAGGLPGGNRYRYYVAAKQKAERARYESTTG